MNQEPATIVAAKPDKATDGRRQTAGSTVTTSSINLPPELWDRLDALRGDLTRSA